MFSEKLIKLRKQAGLSQEQLAEKLNVSRQAVSRWENGETMPETAKVIQLGKLFEVSLDYLLTDETEKTPPVVGAPEVEGAPSLREPEPAPQPVESIARKTAPRMIAGWILTGVGSLGYLILWVLSTMIKSYENYSYKDRDGVVWHSIRDGYSWEGFVDRYRLEALLWILGGMLVVGLCMLLWKWIEKLD